uniref:Peptidase C1A papain C-terminal domain-containing protein n=1 Tax=Strombidium rassoulzadegani TaxID=1082188 RepID=A0A7S3FW15_9SPIT|mmetsp:Transcript_17512/g.29502  ORF Transcript_17512/g.29502 Transcript_17512/m.29502 type:complete len:286 (+) Transcript_17512:445-1302(+)
MRGVALPLEPEEQDELVTKRMLEYREFEEDELDKIKLPAYKNWYKEGFVTRPLDQGSCGGCWAFSAISTTESLALMAGVEKELREYSIQQLLECDTDNYGCTGGWMYQGFAYISQNGVLPRTQYTDFKRRTSECSTTNELLDSEAVMKDIGYVEHDGRSNAQLKQLLMQQPLSVGMYTTGMMSAYKTGVMTNDFLHCSYIDLEVNHGVVLVGFGKVNRGDRVRGRCREYWIVRNSWGPNWGEEGFMRICMDGTGSKNTPVGSCLINRYTTWPTMNKEDIDPDFTI